VQKKDTCKFWGVSVQGPLLRYGPGKNDKEGFLMTCRKRFAVARRGKKRERTVIKKSFCLKLSRGVKEEASWPEFLV